MMSRPPPASLAPALELLRRGDPAGARAAVASALVSQPNAHDLLAFAGLLAAKSSDPASAIPYFRRALAAAPNDLATKINLATALVATGALDEAGDLCAGAGDPKLLRMAAFIHQERGRLAEAAAAYQAVLHRFPDDFESWNNLGNVRAALGEADGAVAAFERAVALRPDIVEMALNLSEALAVADRHEERAAVMREAVKIHRESAAVQTELGLALSSLHDFVGAERAYREAIRLDRQAVAAWLELGLLLENLNRVDDLVALAGEASGPELAFIKAWALRRQGKFAEALPLAESTPATINPVRRAQLLAELYDRLGEPQRAFAAFAEMNWAALATRPARPGPSYRATVGAAARAMTRERVAAWSRIEFPAEPPSPTFIAGFPRSGTTLLDTLLMNVGDLHVLEELPMVHEIEASLGAEVDLGRMTAEEAKTKRAYYFQRLSHYAPPPPGHKVVDKHPLHMARMPLIHRLFPDARIILVERHPCDAVLSCFMANFQLNDAMRSFTDLDEAARTYDAVFDAWSRAEALLPLTVHRVRYERMVTDLEGEMRGLLAFLGRPWNPAVLDNRAAAAGRGHVRTASYSQITEPIYTRAAGRWRRYHEELAPVLPILAPWAERLGYEL